MTLYTLQLQAQDDKIEAHPRVAVEYGEYYIECDKAIYDKTQKLLRLYGDIFILSDKGLGTYADFALFDLRSKKVISKPFFLSDSGSLLWVAGSQIDAKEERIKLKEAYISSCDINCSDWRIYFKKGEYDRSDNWVNLYHIKFYAKEYPILYLPYLGFSTLKKRHSGLLRPKIGISSKEGLVYIQPLFFAPQNWWDLEFDPQIRTKRGKGIYATFRFVDSPYSFGKITAGYFKEFSGSVDTFRLKNDQHYGADMLYRRYYLLSAPEDEVSSDGLYIDWKIYNDVDYYNLQKTELIEGINSIVTSRFNYYYDRNDNYFGLYAKYFKDNQKADNSDTLQLLPQLHYHRYNRSIFLPNLYYNVDFTVSHFYREVGLNALEYRLNLPIKLTQTFFDDFLGFSISENLFVDYADYNFVDKHLNKKWRNSYVYRNRHEISFFSDLLRPYEHGMHTLHLDATVHIPSFEKK
ncbi:MAG: LPS-assembly protein LptD, partial [Epsilonproteobacteria bacterium]|nr:LPS-assembly protein LptD [Campylobacterota bacterium]